MTIPDSEKIYPRLGDTQIVYLKNVIENSRIEIGDFTFYNDFVHDPRDFQKNNVLYPACGEPLIGGLHIEQYSEKQQRNAVIPLLLR
jgi:hypothetical protein